MIRINGKNIFNVKSQIKSLLSKNRNFPYEVRSKKRF
jgi:hypothetical protein